MALNWFCGKKTKSASLTQRPASGHPNRFLKDTSEQSTFFVPPPFTVIRTNVVDLVKTTNMPQVDTELLK
jgi:hypothetical protein